MGKFVPGYESIKVKLINFAGNDLGRQCCEFGQNAEFYEPLKDGYSPDNPQCQKIARQITEGMTFPRYAFDGHSIAFQIEGISRVNLAQLTRERGFFCSASGGVRPLTQEFVVPRYIYNHPEWMERLKKIEDDIESLYVDMIQGGTSYVDARYFGFHAQTINITYNASAIDFLKALNKRTENNFADEINYLYRLMFRELKKAIAEQVTDPNSKLLWDWLIKTFAMPKRMCKNFTYNNDFKLVPEPAGFQFEEPAHNDWTRSSWKLELERMLEKEPDLLFPGEKEMIENWQKLEKEGKPLPTTFDPNFHLSPVALIKKADYFDKGTVKKNVYEE